VKGRPDGCFVPEPIVVKLMDGLGNQLFQYALGRRLAAGLGVELVLDPAWYTEGRRPAQPRPLALSQFAIRARLATGEDFRRFWIRPTLPGRIWWRVEQALLPLRWRKLVEQDPAELLRRGRMFDPRVLRVRPGAYLAGWWVSARYFEGMESELREELRLVSPLEGAAADWAARLNGSASVAVHVRRGDYHRHPEIGLLDAAYYARAVEQLEARYGRLEYFLFSDDLDEAMDLLQPVIPGLQIVALEIGGSPAVDLSVMAKCRHFITANSTFSWWGAWLGSHPEKSVLVPHYWYAGARVAPPDVYPEAWLRIPN